MRYSMWVLLSLSSSLCIADDNKDLEASYEIYNHQVSLCTNLKKRKLSITDHYFSSLSHLEKNVILFETNKAAMRRCYAGQEDAYTLALVNDAINSGNRKTLDEFLQLRQHDKTDARAKAVLDKLDQNELNRIMHMDELYFPFDYTNVQIESSHRPTQQIEQR